MSKDIFGLAPETFQKKVESEKVKIEEIRKIFKHVIDQIKYTAEEDGWHRLIIFSNNSVFSKDVSYAVRMMFFYYLRRDKNILSKLSNKERKNLPESMKPFLFKYVSPDEKNEMGINAIFFRGVPESIKNYIFRNITNHGVGMFVDVLSVLEFLCSKKKQWNKISVFNISAFSGVPIENVRFALNTLLKLKLVVFGYVACKKRTGRRTLNIKITFSELEYQEAVRGVGINAEKIISSEDALDTDFEFSTIKYFYDSLEDTGSKKIFIEEKSEKLEKVDEPEKIEKISQPAVAEKIPPINIVVPEVEGLRETLNNINHCIVSFTDIAKSMYDNEIKRNELINSFMQKNSQQSKEYDELYNQMLAMKKILNKNERDKYQLVKDVQDSLNMMMGQIITETDSFARIPRHQLNEHQIQKYKAGVIQIAVQTAEEIRKLINKPTEN